MHGQIPHRLPESPPWDDGQGEEAVETASGRGGSIDAGIDDAASEFRSDFVGLDSGEGSSSGTASSLSSSESENLAEASLSGDGEEEIAGKGAEATNTGARAREGGEERATATPTTAADTGASPSTPSTPTPTKTPRPSWPPPRRPKKTYPQLQLPSPEQMAQEDAMNNCGVRTVLSGVMGAGLGVVFGIFMGTMDMAGVSSSGSRGVSLFIVAFLIRSQHEGAG